MWTRIGTILALAVCVGLLGACKNENHCKGNPNDDCRLDGAITCSSNEQCGEPTPVCNTATMACVQCTPQDDAACTGATPVCGDDSACRGCSAHAECSTSDVCLPEGRCADPGEVAYVQAGGTGAQPCTKEAPCGTLQQGVTAASPSRPYIKISGAGTLAESATNRLELNSFNRNKALDTLGTAIHCLVSMFTARNNIMSVNGTLSNMEQVGGNCAHAYSIVRPGMLPPGPGNSSMDPLFVNATTGDLHVSAGSPALGAAR